MKKIILNKSYGGFSVSPECYKKYAEKTGTDLFAYSLDFVHEEDRTRVYLVKRSFDNNETIFDTYLTKDFGDRVLESKVDNKYFFHLDEKHRDDPLLVQIVEELGEDANGRFSNLQIVEVPDDVAEDYVIDDYDGIETLHKRVQEW